MVNSNLVEDTLGYIMSKPVRTVSSDATLGDALRTMVKHDIGAVIVMKDQTPVGIVTERDISRQIVATPSVMNETVDRTMSKPLRTADEGMSVQQAFELMLKHGIRRLGIVDSKQRLIGIVTEKDLMRWVLRVSYEPNIPEHIKSILERR